MVMGCIAACRYSYSTRQVPAPSTYAWTDELIATTVDTLHHMHHTHPPPYRSGCAAPLPADNEGAELGVIDRYFGSQLLPIYQPTAQVRSLRVHVSWTAQLHASKGNYPLCLPLDKILQSRSK